MGHREPEISGAKEGDPIGKPSNTNETGGRRRSETAENPKLSITCSLFELETPDFEQKFVWTVRTKYKYKKVQKYKVLITSPFFELQTLDLAWKFILTV